MKKVTIIGAGPSGLAAADVLTKGCNWEVSVYEMADKIGGISRTENYKGYLFDIGGHRFYTKNKKIEALWQEALGTNLRRVKRQSRIYYNHRFFAYPLQFHNTIRQLGLRESIRVTFSFLWAALFPLHPENTFDRWTINRFGRRLYTLFFKSYTEKVWGISCERIQADWAAQRIKGLSFITTLQQAVFGRRGVRSLIEEFTYPKYGPGMMWERIADRIVARGGRLCLNHRIIVLRHENGRISEVVCHHGDTCNTTSVDQVISSMPLDNLIALLEPAPPEEVRLSAKSIRYRSFLIVVLIVKRREVFPDQWLYIHCPDTKVGRIQNFKNWSTAMVPDTAMTSLGMEYFCDEGDALWNLADSELQLLATREAVHLGLIEAAEVVDCQVLRQPKAYPVYDDNYQTHLQHLRTYLRTFINLQTVGRNGLHRYNNMDHSMLTGIMAAENIQGSNHDLWALEDPDDYLEEMLSTSAAEGECAFDCPDSGKIGSHCPATDGENGQTATG